MNELVQKTIDIAISQDGVREIIVDGHGTNTGPAVDRYLADVGRAPGDAWCAAFVHWCADNAAADLGEINPIVRTGACEVIREWAKHHGLLETQPQAGDLFLRVGYVDDGNGPVWRAHHTGFVVSVEDDGIHTIEGNTNNNGSREGIGVFRLIHPIDDKRVFVRWSRLADAEEPAWTLLGSDGSQVTPLRMHGGRSLVPVRKWGDMLGFTTELVDGELVYSGKTIPTQISIVDGVAYAGVRDLAQDAGLHLAIDGSQRTIQVSR